MTDFSGGFKEFKDTLHEEVEYYLNMREKIPEYISKCDNDTYIEYLEQYFNEYPEYYNALYLAMDTHQVDQESDNIEDYYTLFAVSYFNIVDEIIQYLELAGRLGEGEAITFRDIISHIDQQDFFYMQLDNMKDGFEKPLVGAVSNVVILKAIRQILGDPGTLIEGDTQ